MSKIINFQFFLKLVLTLLIIEKTCCKSPGRDLIFDKLGQYGSKAFYIPKNIKGYWQESRQLCKEFKLDFARFETKAEADYIFGVFASYGTTNLTAFVDGITTVPGTKTGWYWVKNKLSIDYLSAMAWTTGQPNNFQSDQYCLAVDKVNGTVGWNDVPCYANANAISTAAGPRPFICQTW